MNSKRVSLLVLGALFLAWLPAAALHAEPVKPAPRLSVRVVDQVQLDKLFQTVCRVDASGSNAQSKEQALASSFAFLEADCSNACCAHCTRCANTGELDDCNYCDVHCAAALNE